MTEELSDLARRLHAVLTAARPVWVPVEDLRLAAQEADWSMRGAPDARERLRDAVDELVAAGLARVPARGGRLWENHPHPPLPLRVGKPAGAPAAPRPRPPEIAWHHRLRWVPRFVAEERPTAEELALLVAVNGLLRDGPARVVPLRERSFQLTGKEKALDQFARGRLFAPDRLTLPLLGAEAVNPPLVDRRIGGGPAALVVENYTTYHSLVETLPREDGRPVPGRAGAADRTAVDWLPAQLRERAMAVLARGRIPQEAVGLEQLVGMDLRDP